MIDYETILVETCRGGGLIALLSLLMFTPIARAATNYDVSSIATTSVQLYDSDGKTLVQQTVDGKTTNGPTVYRNGIYLQINISGTLKQRVAEGDTITIPLTMKPGSQSHYSPNVPDDGSMNLDPNVRDTQGRLVFTAHYTRQPTQITLTATKEAASLTNISFTIRPRLYLFSYGGSREVWFSSSNTWMIAGHTVTFPNSPTVNQISTEQHISSTLDRSFATGFSVWASTGSGGIINDVLNNKTPSHPLDQDRLLVFTFTPLDGPILYVASYDGISPQWRLGYDENTLGIVEWMNLPQIPMKRVTVTSENQISTVETAGRTLKPNEYASYKRADGVWQYAVNLGPIRDHSLPEYDMQDAITQKTYDRARQLGLSAQIKFALPTVWFTVHGVKQRARVDFTTSYGNTGSYEGSNSLTSNDASGQPLGWVAYDGNGATGGSTESSTGVAGSLVDVAQNGFTRLGYKFSHWDTSRDGSGIDYYPADDGEPADKVQLVQTGTTLYAQWAPASAVVNYRGHPQNITGVMSSYHGLTGDAVNVSDNTGYSYPGHTFVGWCALKPGSVENDCNPNADDLDDTKVKLIKPGDSITLGDNGFQYSTYPDGTLVLDLYTVWKPNPSVGVLPQTGGGNQGLLFITVGGLLVIAAGLPWMIRRFNHRDR